MKNIIIGCIGFQGIILLKKSAPSTFTGNSAFISERYTNLIIFKNSTIN